MKSARGWMLPLALAAACSTRAPEGDTLASLTVGVAVPAVQQSPTPIGIQYHRDALTRETLVQLGIDGRPAPRVLESWTSSDDGLTWRLKVRGGIRFHDSTPVTAHELVPGLRTAPMAAQLGKIQSVEAAGDDTLVIRLRERFAFLPEDLGQVTAVRTVQEKDGQGKVVATHRFGTGPYRVEFESADRLRMQEFPNHYRGDPGVSAIEVKLFPDQRNTWSALMRNEIDVLYEVSPHALDFVRSESTVHVATFPRAYVYVFAFNSSLPALRNPTVRRALNHAIDREALVRIALSNEGEAAAGHVWPRHWAHDASVRAPQYDPRESIRLMEAAGLKVRPNGDHMPARLRLHCAVYAPFREMALVLQRQLAQVDVDLQLEIVELRDFVDRAGKGQYETFLFQMTSGRTVMWPYLFWHSTSPLMRHGYNGADDVLDRMRLAADDNEMRAATAAFQRRLLEDPPAAFLAWGRVSRAVTKRFELPATGDDIYHTIPKWKLASPRRGTN